MLLVRTSILNLSSKSTLGSLCLSDERVKMEVLSSEALEYGKTDYKKRLYDDTTTWLAEALDGSMRTSFELSYIDGELYSGDGGSIGEVFKNSLADAESLPANLGFEWRRRKHELNEYYEMLEMMEGSNFNTIIVVSDFPCELDGQDDTGGYNTKRKQTMLRVITKNDSNTLCLTSQTLDGSNRKALEAIYEYFELEAEAGELLGQRIHLQLDKSSQDILVNILTDVYDESLTQQFGGDWTAGRLKYIKTNTYDFIRQQSDLVEYYIQSVENFGEDKQLLLGVVSAIEARYQNKSFSNESADGYYNYESLSREVINAFEIAISNNQQFSGCGLSLNNSEDIFTDLSQAGYGSLFKPEQKYSFNKKMYCVVCQAPPKENGEPKKMCGPCGICKSCDSKLSSKINKA